MKRIILFTVITLALCLALTSQMDFVAYADDGIILEESETASAWSEWLPRIEAIGVSAATIIAIVLMFIREIKSLVGKVKSAVGELKNTDEELKIKSTVLDKAKGELETAKAELENTKAQIVEMQTTLEHIATSLNIALCNNAELVKKGFAKDIAELLGGKDEQNT